MIRKIKTILIEWLRRKGYILLKKNDVIFDNNLAYNFAIHPYATYAPWENDQVFNQVYESIKNNTLISERLRIYELWQLSLEVKDLDGDYIEVGCWRGGSGALIATVANKHSSGSNIYLCDTFEGVVKASEKDNAYQNQEHADTSPKIVFELINRLGLKNIEILKGIFPDDTGAQVESNKFKFCHIDVDVYESAKSVTEWIWDKMVLGGVIVFDDFGFKSMQGVTLFVESQRMKSDRLVIHNLNGHGIIIKIR